MLVMVIVVVNFSEYNVFSSADSIGMWHIGNWLCGVGDIWENIYEWLYLHVLSIRFVCNFHPHNIPDLSIDLCRSRLPDGVFPNNG